MKKHEADVTVSGILAGREEIKGKVYILVKVERGQYASLFRLSLDDEQARFASTLKKGENVLIQGKLWGKRKENGFFDLWISCEDIYTRAGHGRDDAAPAPGEHWKAKANGYQPQAQAEEPLPWEKTMANDDIPF